MLASTSRSLWAAIGLHWGCNFAGQFADTLAAIDVLAPSHGTLLSAAAHLAVLGAVVVVTRTRLFAGCESCKTDPSVGGVC